MDALNGLPRRLDESIFGMTPEGITQAVQPDHSDGHGGEVRAESAVARADRGSPHDHRHETTSRLFEKELNPMEMAVIVGHKKLEPLKRYTHLRAEAKRLG